MFTVGSAAKVAQSRELLLLQADTTRPIHDSCSCSAMRSNLSFDAGRKHSRDPGRWTLDG